MGAPRTALLVRDDTDRPDLFHLHRRAVVRAEDLRGQE